MIVAFAAVALAEDLRDAATSADDARDWPAALAAWERCAAEAPPRDARYCATRAAALAPHAADGFAGWSVLEGVRRDYRALDPREAMARVEAALAANPDGPAATAMRLWLSNAYRRAGDLPAAARVEAALRAGADAPEAQYAAALAARDEADASRRRIATYAAFVASLYAGIALLRRGPFAWGSAATAGIFVGGIPGLFASAYDPTVAPGFARTGAVIAVAVLLSRRAPVWISVPGTLGGLAAMAWYNDWYPSLGL